jgi:predicted transcriptional regulator
MGSTTLTIRISPAVDKRLGQLADRGKMTKSDLASEAISDFVERELAIVAGIKRGLDDMNADRVVPHKQAIRRLRATVARTAKARA